MVLSRASGRTAAEEGCEQEDPAAHCQGITELLQQKLDRLQAEYCNKYHQNPGDSFKRFAAGLLKGEPRIVLLMNKGPRGAILHAVLAYEYLPEHNAIRIYDPNYINDERFIDLEKRQYTSLDITYNAICFPEVLQQHPSLVNKMENLYTLHVEQQRLPWPMLPYKHR